LNYAGAARQKVYPFFQAKIESKLALRFFAAVWYYY